MAEKGKAVVEHTDTASTLQARPQPEFPSPYPKRTPAPLTEAYYGSSLSPARYAHLNTKKGGLRWLTGRMKLAGGALAALAAWGGYTMYMIHTIEEGKYVARSETVYWFKLMPLRKTSELFGRLASTELPHWLRGPVIGGYARLFGCNLMECERTDPSAYTSLQDFFTRTLAPGARTMSDADLICPCDGLIVRQGEVYDDKGEEGWVDQIKGWRYKLSELLGVTPARHAEDKKRVYCVFWLSPSDYHRFHVPADNWKINRVVHTPGFLFPVHPLSYKFIDELFTLNERVAMCGQWLHGKLFCVAVGANNVGSIQCTFDRMLHTNNPRDTPKVVLDHAEVVRHVTDYDEPVDPGQRGAELGLFRMGSTIVLVADVPKDWDWCAGQGDLVRVGNGLMRSPAAA